MSRRAISLPIFMSIALATGCGGHRTKTTSQSVGSKTPVVAVGSNTETGSTEAPAVAGISYEKAEGSFRAGRYGEATQLFAGYTENNPDNAWGFYMLGLAAWKSGEPTRAVQAFDRALQLDPSHQKSWFNSARVLLEMGHSQAALDRIEKALSSDPTSSEGLRLLGRAHYQLGQVDQAIEAYHRALGLDDRDVWAMNNLGLIYIEQGHSQEALPPLARAVEIQGNSPVFENNLGTALERSGYPVAAAKAYEAALTVDSTYQKASASLARVTGAGAKEDSDSLDLGALARSFQSQSDQWRISASPSDTTQPDPTSGAESGPDSSIGRSLGLSDSSVASVEAVSDSVEDCAREE